MNYIITEKEMKDDKMPIIREDFRIREIVKLVTQAEYKSLVSIDISHRDPDILNLRSLIQKLLTTALLRILPVPCDAVVHPSSLHVLS